MKIYASILFAGLAATQITLAQPQPQTRRIDPTTGIFEIYSRLTGRTLLKAGSLPQLPEAASIISQIPADTNRAVAFIEDALARNQIEVVRDGELFARIAPKSSSDLLATALARLHLPSREVTTNDESIPPGMVSFTGSDLDQFLDIYSKLCNRTVLRPSSISSPPINLSTRTPLTKEEVIYAMNVVLILNGNVTVDDGDKFVQVVPLKQLSQVQARAPKPDASAPLINPTNIPAFYLEKSRPKPSSAPAPQSPSPPPFTIVHRLGSFYAQLVGREFMPSSVSNDPRPIFLKVQTPMTKAELLYAIETVLSLSDLMIVPGDNNSIRVERSGGQPEVKSKR